MGPTPQTETTITTVTAATVTTESATATSSTKTSATATSETTTSSTANTTICGIGDVCVCFPTGCLSCDGENYTGDVLLCQMEADIFYGHSLGQRTILMSLFLTF